MKASQEATAKTSDRNARSAAFTLVEVLVVVVILGILAAIVVPQFTSASDDSRESALKMDLHRIRTQLEIYNQHHADTYPTLANFKDQMTLATDGSGVTAPPDTPGFPFGPYLRDVPPNPYTGTNTLGDGALGSSDWYYDQLTGAFHANDTAVSNTF